ncbi:molybdenum cofactor guanylyltransferase [Octadecabacter temperatus]|uniref:Molybdenum cofactor guanylyltransferase n=1 Tax=Octadecabacter temperatus TaxID=1458307 RepID=A0A0K0Y905_9RHOB|nr:molybdenum cofactor guanylyltransferase MobA [Octadecabacter temperatus]AKS47448.1 Molybdenum cofactor guanylyltransferase [Octadecabacter temperatus]SIO42587.1 molybdenum cofactor guanylyltransferase [Octadecabacter temperatus]
MREPLGLILSGGLGSRMGGALKSDLLLGGATLLARVADRLEPQVAGLVVNSNVPVATKLPVVADTTPENFGPLAGILAGLDWAREQNATHIVSVAVDTPFFPCDLVPQLLMAGLAHPEGLAVAATTDGLHGTFGIWPVSLRDPLSAFLADGQRKVSTFTQAQNAAIAQFPDTSPPSFFNINTNDDLNTAAQWL